MAVEPGPLLASGRDGDIFEFGPGLVLRRRADGRVDRATKRASCEYVARARLSRARIDEVRAGGTEIVMERIEGPMMMDAMLRRPWQHARATLRMLADLHDQLHVIPAPDWLPRCSTTATGSCISTCIR